MRALQLRRADSIARGFAIDAVEGRKAEVNLFLDHTVRAVYGGRFGGIDPASLLDMAQGARDAISNIVAGMRRDLDDAGSDPDSATVDTSELDGLIAKLEREARLAKMRGTS